MTESARRPLIWSIAGNDSGGGAGLSADARAAAAFGMHLCPVVAALTAQNSVAVTRVEAVAPALLEAQLAALAADLPPVAIKTGLLGSADNVAVVARWVDALRARGLPLALVVDPVLGASTGAGFADAATLRAYRELLLPRATLITPNEREAARLLSAQPGDRDDGAAHAALPRQAEALRALGAQAVAITGGDSAHAAAWALDWIATPHASGWLALPRIDSPHTHGTGCTFATSAACALALGFVAADALVLAKQATAHAIARGYAAGQGAGPVAAGTGFAAEAARMPLLSWGEDRSELDSYKDLSGKRSVRFSSESGAPDVGLYAIVDSAHRVEQVLAAGVRTVQLRVKTPEPPALADAPWQTRLREAVLHSAEACRAAGAVLVLNDHAPLAAELARGRPALARHLAVHLGQEDVLALGAAGRQALAASGLALWLSSHSLRELARGRSLRPWYLACGPVWPTLTKAMPWLPQGLDNLAWWVRMAGVPVVAIGGILTLEQAEQAARTGAAGVCVVRGLGADPAQTVPGWRAAIARGRAAPRLEAPPLPHPSLPQPAAPRYAVDS